MNCRQIQVALGMAALAAALVGPDLPAQSTSSHPAQVQAQQRPDPGMGQPAQQAPADRWRQSGQRRHPQGRRQSGERGRRVRELFRRLAALPPDQQRQALESNQFFRRLPPRAQERFHRRLRALNELPLEQRRRALENIQRFAELAPERQQRMRRRAQIFQRMTPEQRQRAQRVFGAWRRLPPERRQLLRQRLRRLQQAEPARRGALIDDPAFLDPLRPGERRLLRGLWGLRQALPGEGEL
jgi:hypothetical protein